MKGKLPALVFVALGLVQLVVGWLGSSTAGTALVGGSALLVGFGLGAWFSDRFSVGLPWHSRV